jgi:hypothetical protein
MSQRRCNLAVALYRSGTGAAIRYNRVLPTSSGLKIGIACEGITTVDIINCYAEL